MRNLQDDFIENGREYDQLAENSVAIDTPRDGWRPFARILSMRFGGQFWASNRSLTWVFGRRVCYCIDRVTVKDVLRAQSCAESIGIEKPPWTAGSIARRVVGYIESPQKGDGNCADLIQDRHGYYSCEPGQYQGINLFDVRACYWQLFCLLPSLRMVFHQGSKKIQFLTMDDSAAARFADVKRAFAGSKIVRNAILGCLLGSSEPAAYYSHGEKRYLNLPPGPNRPAAYVIIRTAWELAQQAAMESDSVMTMVDAICTPHFDPPPIWGNVGLRVKREASGDADIVRPGVYAVGDKWTIDYLCGDRNRVAVPHPPAPEFNIGVWL